MNIHENQSLDAECRYQTFRAWRMDGTWRQMHDQLRAMRRIRLGRHPQPSAAIIDPQTVKTTAIGGRMVMMGRRNVTAASAVSSWTRRVSGGVSSSTPPI
jgi:transposase